jgi:hypothetical protein
MATKAEKRAALLRQVQTMVRQREVAPAQAELAAVLDGLDTWGVLENARDRAPQGTTFYGPGVVRRGDAVGVVLWHKAPGFHGYKTLTLFGVWAVAGGRLVVGTKRLTYSAATYNPESYHKLIRKGYKTYYKDDNVPPSDPLWSATYTPGERLVLRRHLAVVVDGYLAPR